MGRGWRWCVVGLHYFDGHGGEFGAVGKGLTAGSVGSSSLANYKDKKWLHLPTASGKGGDEWGVLVNFMLCG